MNLIVFVCVLFGLQLVCFIVGNKTSKSMETQQDYFLASKGLTFFPLMMTFVATQVGGGLVLGAAEEAYRFGWQVLLYPLGAVLGLLLLACGLGKKMAQSGVATVAQLFEVAFGSVVLKRAASVLSIVSLFMILVAQIIASKKFMTSLGVESSLIFFGFWAVAIVYTAMGGLKAVVSTDIVQAGFFGCAFFFCFLYALTISPAIDAEMAGARAQGFVLAEHKLTGWLLMPLLFMVIEQDMGQRCFAAQTPRTVSLAAGAAALVTMALCAIPVYFGVLAKSVGFEVTYGGSVLMSAIMSFTNPVIAAFVGCAVLAAIISTADSLINAISSNFSQDFEFAFLKDGKSIRAAQIMTGCISALAMAGSVWFDNIVDLLIQSYELSVCCLFIPVCVALFKSKGNFLSASLSIAFGAAAYIVFKFFYTPIPREILCVLLSLLGYGVGEVILRSQHKVGLKASAPSSLKR
jgi:SSS family solute:Na+ symporter